MGAVEVLPTPAGRVVSQLYLAGYALGAARTGMRACLRVTSWWVYVHGTCGEFPQRPDRSR